MLRRTLLQLAISGVAERLRAASQSPGGNTTKKLVLVTIGGIRRQESFSPKGIVHIPHLTTDLLPQSLFFPYTVNEGVTSHFNTIASIITGVWQHVDDWGGQKPSDPTLFQYLQSQLGLNARDTWVVSSNKQLTANISAGVNVILSKQLMIEAVERIILGGGRKQLERDQLLTEMRTVLDADYERIGWGIPSASSFQSPEVRQTLVAGLESFIHGPDAPATGDELTFLIGREVLQHLSPAMLMMNFSDVEVAHVGSYALHLGGIRRADLLCFRLWQFIQASPELRGRTTLVILDEFGRDPDGSSTNGFFNHRTNTESCRMAWSIVLGPAVKKPEVVERVVRQIDIAPSIASWMGIDCSQAKGSPLPEIVVS